MFKKRIIRNDGLLVKKGKISYYGVSVFKISEALAALASLNVKCTNSF